MNSSFFSWVSHNGGKVLPKVEFFPWVFFIKFCPWVLVFSAGGAKKKLAKQNLQWHDVIMKSQVWFVLGNLNVLKNWHHICIKFLDPFLYRYLHAVLYCFFIPHYLDVSIHTDSSIQSTDLTWRVQDHDGDNNHDGTKSKFKSYDFIMTSYILTVEIRLYILQP